MVTLFNLQNLCCAMVEWTSKDSMLLPSMVHKFILARKAKGIIVAGFDWAAINITSCVLGLHMAVEVRLSGKGLVVVAGNMFAPEAFDQMGFEMFF
jgi:hypothetical protein